MPSDVSEDTFPTESAMLDSDSPKMLAEGTQINKEGHWSFQQKQRCERR